MELTAPIIPGRPLLVAALAGEAKYLRQDLPLLLTGVGKVRAATALTRVLAETSQRPNMIINVGTAGALKPNLSGVFEIGRIIQHDFSDAEVKATTGVSYGAPLALPRNGTILASGDSFIESAADRDRLVAMGAELCDMEGYALAFVARNFGVPIRLLKAISDAADEAAATSWQDTLDRCAKLLAAEVANV